MYMMAEWVKISWTLILLTFSPQVQSAPERIEESNAIVKPNKVSAVERCHEVYHTADFLRGIVMDVSNLLQIEGSVFVNDAVQIISTSLTQLGEKEVDDLRFLQNVTLDEAKRILNVTVEFITDYIDSCLEICLFLKSPIINDSQISNLKNMSNNFLKKNKILKDFIVRNAQEMEDMLAQFGDYIWSILIHFESARNELLKRMTVVQQLLLTRKYYITRWSRRVSSSRRRLNDAVTEITRNFQDSKVQKAPVKSKATVPEETQQESTAIAIDRCHQVYHSADFLRGLVLDVFNMLQTEGSIFVSNIAQIIVTSLIQLGEKEVDDLLFLQDVTLDEAKRMINESSIIITDYMDSCLDICLFLKSPITNQSQISDLKNMTKFFHKKTLIVKDVVMRRSKEMEEMLAEFGDYIWAILIHFESAQDEVLKRMAVLGHMLSARKYYVSRCRRKVSSHKSRFNEIVIKLIKKLEAQIPKKEIKTNGAVILY